MENYIPRLRENYIPRLEKLGFLVTPEGVERIIRTSNSLTIGVYQLLKNPSIMIFLETGNDGILEEEVKSIEMLQKEKIPGYALSKEAAIEYLNHGISSKQKMLQENKIPSHAPSKQSVIEQLTHEILLKQNLLKRIQKIEY